MLVDTNVLLRAAQPSHPLHGIAVRALRLAMERDEPLCVTVQNIVEFWNAATRPISQNGLGYTVDEAQAELARLDTFFDVLSESADSYAVWKTLLVAQRVRGVQAHDARLVAVMKAHGVTSILTFDRADFLRYPRIEVVHPADMQPVE